MRVGVLGGGVGGLALARALTLRCKMPVDVKVFERRAGATRGVDRGLGIWSNAQGILSKLDVDLSGHTRHIRPAAYRDYEHGRWLSEATDSAGNRTKVLTMPESALLPAMAKGVDVAYGHECVGIDDCGMGNGVELRFSDGSKHACDVVVGADGGDGIVRQNYFPETPRPTPTGWSTISAVSKRSVGVDKAFETLGPYGVRFACVPLTGDTQFWFATVPTAWLGFGAAALDRTYVSCLLSDLGLEDWHDPIPRLLLELRTGDDLHLLRRSGHNDTHTHSYTKSTNNSSSAPPLQTHHQQYVERHRDEYEEVAPLASLSSSDHRAFLVGDAAHAMGNNLAQGATVAIGTPSPVPVYPCLPVCVCLLSPGCLLLLVCSCPSDSADLLDSRLPVSYLSLAWLPLPV
jgi:2-polyprenyl-6-methoxyphenol hydroxylase-like FAD-dependent oxidoreductase